MDAISRYFERRMNPKVVTVFAAARSASYRGYRTVLRNAFPLKCESKAKTHVVSERYLQSSRMPFLRILNSRGFSQPVQRKRLHEATTRGLMSNDQNRPSYQPTYHPTSNREIQPSTLSSTRQEMPRNALSLIQCDFSPQFTPSWVLIVVSVITV